MYVTIENYRGEEIAEVELYYSHKLVGHGHWKIECRVTIGKGAGYVGGDEKIFRKLVYAGFVDALSDLKANDPTWEEIQEFYHEEAFNDLQESISEWVEGFYDDGVNFA
jgi:hypothetical protein